MDHAIEVWLNWIDKRPALDAIIKRFTTQAENVRADAVEALWQKIKDGDGNAALKDIAALKSNLLNCVNELDAISDAVTTRLGSTEAAGVGRSPAPLGTLGKTKS